MPVSPRVPKPVPDYPGKMQMRKLTAPLVEPLARNWAGAAVQRLLGFWVLWSVYGDMSKLIESGLMARATVYKNRAEFLRVFGVNVEDFHPEAAKGLLPLNDAAGAAAPSGE